MRRRAASPSTRPRAREQRRLPARRARRARGRRRGPAPAARWWTGTSSCRRPHFSHSQSRVPRPEVVLRPHPGTALTRAGEVRVASRGRVRSSSRTDGAQPDDRPGPPWPGPRDRAVMLYSFGGSGPGASSPSVEDRTGVEPLGDDMLLPAHGRGGVRVEDLADDEPVAEHADPARRKGPPRSARQLVGGTVAATPRRTYALPPRRSPSVGAERGTTRRT